MTSTNKHEQLRLDVLQPQLPEELVVEIMYKLPVKSLVRFRCVSKRWNSRLSSTKFAKSHHKLNYAHTTQKLLISSSPLKTLDPESQSFGDKFSVRNPSFSKQSKQPNRIYLLGSCNGLVIVALGDDFHDWYIWNPSTSFVRKLPDPDFVARNKLGNKHVTYLNSGLGYVPATDDYKIILLVNSDPHIEMFSSRANSWKAITEAPGRGSAWYFDIKPNGVGAVSNEALHWVSARRYRAPTVLAFDLEKGKFRPMPLFPISEYEQDEHDYNGISEDEQSEDEDDHNYNSYEYLELVGVQGSSGGRLYAWLTRINDCDRYPELWFMREYNVLKSWTMLYEFHGDDHLRGSCYQPFDANDLIFISDESIVLKFRAGKEHKLMRIECRKGHKLVCGDCYSLTLRSVDLFKHEFFVLQYDETLLSVPN